MLDHKVSYNFVQAHQQWHQSMKNWSVCMLLWAKSFMRDLPTMKKQQATLTRHSFLVRSSRPSFSNLTFPYIFVTLSTYVVKNKPTGLLMLELTSGLRKWRPQPSLGKSVFGSF